MGLTILGGGAVALAAVGDGNSNGPGGARAPWTAMGTAPGLQRMDFGSALHGEFVAADGSGYITYAVQTGEITVLDGNSLSLRSSDGYTRSYELGNVDPGNLKVGDMAQLIATVNGDTATVMRLTNAANGPMGGPGGMGPGGAPGGMGPGGMGGPGIGPPMGRGHRAQT